MVSSTVTALWFGGDIYMTVRDARFEFWFSSKHRDHGRDLGVVDGRQEAQERVLEKRPSFSFFPDVSPSSGSSSGTGRWRARSQWHSLPEHRSVVRKASPGSRGHRVKKRPDYTRRPERIFDRCVNRLCIESAEARAALFSTDSSNFSGGRRGVSPRFWIQLQIAGNGDFKHEGGPSVVVLLLRSVRPSDVSEWIREHSRNGRKRSQHAGRRQAAADRRVVQVRS